MEINTFQITSKFNWNFSKNGVTLVERELNRQLVKLNLPYQRTSYGINSIFYTGVKRWNTIIPNNITSITTFLSFKKKLKIHLQSLVL